MKKDKEINKEWKQNKKELKHFSSIIGIGILITIFIIPILTMLAFYKIAIKTQTIVSNQYEKNHWSTDNI